MARPASATEWSLFPTEERFTAVSTCDVAKKGFRKGFRMAVVAPA